MKINAEISLLR